MGKSYFGIPVADPTPTEGSRMHEIYQYLLEKEQIGLVKGICCEWSYLQFYSTDEIVKKVLVKNIPELEGKPGTFPMTIDGNWKTWTIEYSDLVEYPPPLEADE